MIVTKDAFSVIGVLLRLIPFTTPIEASAMIAAHRYSCTPMIGEFRYA